MLRALLLLALAGRAAAAEPARVALSWEYDGVPGVMTVHEPGPDAGPLWSTGEAKLRAQAPAGRRLPGGAVVLRPGERRQVVLLLRNDGPRRLRFFAAPHGVSPPAASLGFKFKCLCVNHVYDVPAGHWWWRVVEVRLEPSFAGRSLEVRHRLIALPENAVQEKAP